MTNNPKNILLNKNLLLIYAKKLYALFILKKIYVYILNSLNEIFLFKSL